MFRVILYFHQDGKSKIIIPVTDIAKRQIIFRFILPNGLPALFGGIKYFTEALDGFCIIINFKRRNTAQKIALGCLFNAGIV